MRAFPQQSSPFSCRPKHSNRLCSSLRRHPIHVSRALLDVAHVFWHFGVIASEQHNRPDHSEPRAMAVSERKCKRNYCPTIRIEKTVSWITAKRVVHAIPEICLNRWAIAFDVSVANIFPIEIRGQIHQRQLRIVWRKYLIEISFLVLYLDRCAHSMRSRRQSDCVRSRDPMDKTKMQNIKTCSNCVSLIFVDWPSPFGMCGPPSPLSSNRFHHNARVRFSAWNVTIYKCHFIRSEPIENEYPKWQIVRATGWCAYVCANCRPSH